MKLSIKLKIVLLSITMAVVIGAGIGYASKDKHHDMKGKAMKFTGHIIDPVCFTKHNSQGPDHKKCATTCAKAGISMVFLDDASGKIHLLISPKSHKGINELLLDKGLIEEKVTITGKMYEKAGIMSIAVKKIEKTK